MARARDRRLQRQIDALDQLLKVNDPMRYHQQDKPPSWLALALTLSVFGTCRGPRRQHAKPRRLCRPPQNWPSGVELIITYEANHMFAQLPSQVRFEVFPEGPSGIAWKVVDAKADLETAPDSRHHRLDHPAGRPGCTAKVGWRSRKTWRARIHRACRYR